MKNKKDVKYLTQAKITDILGKYFNIEVEVPVEGTRMKTDIQFNHNGEKFAVEFDGDSHYCDLDVIRRDRRKNLILRNDGFRVVRFPFWIQFSNDTFRYFFGFDYPEKIIQEYPHGFIDKKAKTPSYFCNQGVTRFFSEMNSLLQYSITKQVFCDVLRSMLDHKNDFYDVHAHEYGSEGVGLDNIMSHHEDDLTIKKLQEEFRDKLYEMDKVNRLYETHYPYCRYMA
jgi:hypothetical protein